MSLGTHEGAKIGGRLSTVEGGRWGLGASTFSYRPTTFESLPYSDLSMKSASQKILE